MTPGARYQAIIDLYDKIRAEGKPADQVMQSYFRQRKFIGSKDRRFIADNLYHLLRHYGRLRWWLAQIGMEEEGRSLLLALLIFTEGRDARDIDDIFDGQGYGPDTLSRFEHEVTERYAHAHDVPSDMPEHVVAECPEWAYPGLKSQFGPDFAKEMTALQEEAPLDMRVNTLKAERDGVLKELRQDDFKVVETPYSPIGLRVAGRPAFSAHPLYQKGAIEVQDEGSQLLSLLCGAKPGEWIVDFCAGAGGKTLALAAQMQNKGRIWACDIEKNRLENSRKRFRRAGVHCVELQLLDDEDDDWVRKHKGKADSVLIDAPCTGIGTWRRNPFARWQDLGPSLKTLLAVQARILQSAARLVKPGGRLIYATCSMLPAENGEQVAHFIQENPHFAPLELGMLWDCSGYGRPEGIDLGTHMLQLTPGQHRTDGFFIAALKRIN